MKSLFILLITVLAWGCAGPKNASTQPGKLNGTWIPVTQEMGGKSLPAAAFKDQKLIILDSNYTVIAESIDKGLLRYGNAKMDIYGKEGVNAGKHFTAIYKRQGGLLTICYNLLGSGYPEAFETRGKSLYFLSVFKKN